MVGGDRIRTLQALLNRRVGAARTTQIAGLQRGSKGVEILRQLHALQAGARRAVGQRAERLLGCSQIAGLESLRELLKLRVLGLVRALEGVGLIQCAARK